MVVPSVTSAKKRKKKNGSRDASCRPRVKRESLEAEVRPEGNSQVVVGSIGEINFVAYLGA